MARRKRGNGEGSIHQRKDGRWTGQVTVGTCPLTGRQLRRTVYGDTYKEARERLEEVKQQAREGTLDTGSDMSMRVFLDFWLGSCKHSVQPSTYLRYQSDVRNLLPYLGDKKVRDLAALHVTQLYQRMGQDGHSRAVQWLAGSRLRQALKKGVALGLVKQNVASLVPLPRRDRHEWQPLGVWEASQLICKNAERRLLAFIPVALDTGARVGELLALTWADWDVTTQEVSITKSLSRATGKLEAKDTKTPSSRRRVKVSPRTARFLEAHREDIQEEGHGSQLIFPTRDGKYMDRAVLDEHFFQPALAAAGLPRMRIHDLRHTCATWLLMAGVDVKSVACRLGHADASTLLKTYAHVLPSQHDRMASIMGENLK